VVYGGVHLSACMPTVNPGEDLLSELEQRNMEDCLYEGLDCLYEGLAEPNDAATENSVPAIAVQSQYVQGAKLPQMQLAGDAAVAVHLRSPLKQKGQVNNAGSVQSALLAFQDTELKEVSGQQ
jgi:hypothetical protein